MPMFTTSVIVLPVWPFHTPLRRRSVKSRIFASTALTTGTTSWPSTTIAHASRDIRSKRFESCANRSRMWTLSIVCLWESSAFQAADAVRVLILGTEQTTVRDQNGTTTGRVRMNMIDPGVLDRERDREREIRDDMSGWRRWGPYLADRSWGTVREDYSGDGNAW